MLLASAVYNVLDSPLYLAKAALNAAESAALCMVRLLTYHIPTSVPRPVIPSNPVIAKAITTAEAPERFEATCVRMPAARERAHPVERGGVIGMLSLISGSRIAPSA